MSKAGSARASRCNKRDLRVAEDPLAAQSDAEAYQALQGVRDPTVAWNQREGFNTLDQRPSETIPPRPGSSPHRGANLSPTDTTILEGATHPRSHSPQETQTDDNRRDSEWLSSDDRSYPVSARLIDVLISSEYLMSDAVEGEARTRPLMLETASGRSSSTSTPGTDGEHLPVLMTQIFDGRDDELRQVEPADDLPRPRTTPMPLDPLAPLPFIPVDELKHPAHLSIEATTSSTRLSSPTLAPTTKAELQHVGLPATAGHQYDIEAHFAREPLSRSIGRAALVALFLPPHADTQITQGAEPAASSPPFSVLSGSTKACFVPPDTSRESLSMHDQTPALSPATDYGSTMMTTAPTLDTIDIPTPGMDMPERMTSPHLRLDEAMVRESPDTGKAWTMGYQGIRPGPSVRFSWANAE